MAEEAVADDARGGAARGDRAPRGCTTALAAVLPDVVAGGEPDLTRPWCCSTRARPRGWSSTAYWSWSPAEYGASDLYVALTRATQRLGVVHGGSCPQSLRGLLRPAPVTRA